MTAIRAVPRVDPAPVAAAEPGAPSALAQLKILLKTPGMNLGDREFLAPALEILETPPSPVHVAFLWIICAFLVAALAWAYFARVDIVAAAQGKFQPMGQVKVVEPLETGRVEDIRVGNGALVRAARCWSSSTARRRWPTRKALGRSSLPRGRKSCAAGPRS